MANRQMSRLQSCIQVSMPNLDPEAKPVRDRFDTVNHPVASSRHGRLSRSQRKRMLIIANPHAAKVCNRRIERAVRALQVGYDVECVSTEVQGHATEIARNAAGAGYDVVVAFGGDGTVNELANGLAGTGIPLSVLPGGTTNVSCRALGMPHQIDAATLHLRRLADSFAPRNIDLGTANERRFVFACGAGLDATTARIVDAHPLLKSRLGPLYYTYAVVSTFCRDYMGNGMRICVSADDRTSVGVTVIVQNSTPFTYIRNVPVTLSPDVSLNDGMLAIIVLQRANQIDAAALASRILVPALGGAARHPHVDELREITTARITGVSLEGKPGQAFPVQVDGDYIGDFTQLDIALQPEALTVLS
jgi:diacylglycerol kinase family enzyme